MTQHDPQQRFGDVLPEQGYSRAWFNLLRCHRSYYPMFAKALKSEGINDPIWYEILLLVERAGDAGQPMGTLQEILRLPQYTLSRHIARMEKAGLLRRVYVADGRRKQILHLTDAGLGRHRRLWPVYYQEILREIGPKLTPDEAYTLTRLLMKLQS